MRAAILCPGPSLATAWPRNTVQHDVVIAVNRAIIGNLSDWWVAGDWMYLKEVDEQPLVGYCTTDEVVRIIRDGTLIPAHRYAQTSICVAWEKLPFQRTFSSVAALGLAMHLGVETVDIFGDDKAGDKDFDGWVGTNRGEGRWAEEIQARDAALARMVALDIAYNYIRP